MTTNGIIKIAIGIALLLVFFPTGYLNLPDILRWILVIIAAVVGIKLILDGINQI